MLPAQQGCEAMDKSEDAFRTISEAAEELDLPQHVLRFWETRFPQIRPLKRGGGRRYYRPDDVELLRVIRHLLYSDGYTIKGVQRMLKERGVRAVLEVRNQAAAEQRAAARPRLRSRGARSSRDLLKRRGRRILRRAIPGDMHGAPFASGAAAETTPRAGSHRRPRGRGSCQPPPGASMPPCAPACPPGSPQARSHRRRTRRVQTNTGRRKHLISVFRLRRGRPASIRPPVGV